jgi:calcineurin-like phosphoesterase family protein
VGGYFIEYRFQGKTKNEIKAISVDINRRFHLRPQKHFVPHISFVTPEKTRDEKRLISSFIDLCARQSVMEFRVKGFETITGKKAERKFLWFTLHWRADRVVALQIIPDVNMDRFRWELCCRLKSFCTLLSYDLERGYKFHCTLAMHIPAAKHQNVFNYLRSKYHPDYRQCVIRATLLKGQQILCEYDFLLRKILTRKEAQDTSILRRTFEQLDIYLAGKKIRGGNLEDYRDADSTNTETTKIFFTSDQHFDHSNIIKYCHRPFQNINEMNSILLNNWNNIVGQTDTVFFLGDLSFMPERWLRLLNGKVTFINGNHGKYHLGIHDLKWRHNGFLFYLVHKPDEIPVDWDGWAIHGHEHNNDIDKHPFFDRKSRRFNVSVEMTGYKPVAIGDLVKVINSGVDRLVYWDSQTKNGLK